MPGDGKWKFSERDAPHIEQARKNMDSRGPTVGASVVKVHSAGQWEIDSPYEDGAAWELLLFDAFGTNSRGACRTFIRQLTSCCGQYWDGDQLAPDEDQLSCIITIVRDAAPKNTTEAALVAQMCAVHLATMKMAEWAVRGNPQSASIMARLARTYAQQMETLAIVKGKGKRSKQTIKVVQEKHIHHHQHVHLEGGAQEKGKQPHEATGTGQPEKRRPMLGKDTPGNIVPIPRNEGKEALQDSWGQKPGRAKG